MTETKGGKMAHDTDARLLLLSPGDNVFVLRQKVLPGETLFIEGHPVRFEKEISLGHKVAVKPVKRGKKIIKYGASIGSATRDIALGEHVHTHNIKSDYTATHTLEAARNLHAGADKNVQRET